MTELILALDTGSRIEARKLLEDLAPLVNWVKVGHRAVCELGLWEITAMCVDWGYKIFVDFKFHDIPSTVRENVRSLTRYGVHMTNVHTMGGKAMMEAAKAIRNPPIVLGVTVLTSHLISLEAVVKLAQNSQDAGLDGVVCSPLEAHAIRKACGDDFLIVTPGIRPVWSSTDDQARHARPRDARDADYIVVGRPILEARDPIGATKRILEELRG